MAWTYDSATGCILSGTKTVAFNRHKRNDEETDADGRLIAAAPDLLAALKLLVADVADYEAWERPCHALDKARAVIAKAEGTNT